MDSPHADAPPMQRYTRSWWRFLWRLRLPLLKRRIRQPMVEEFDGLTLVILPGVLNPVLLRSGAFLAEGIGAHGMIDPGRRAEGSEEFLALDMGTGSGIGALVAARRGYRVVGVDINPAAVRCARANAALNELDSRVEILAGDLFTPLPATARFDLVTFNPPFYRGTPRDAADAAWHSPDVLDRFVAGLPDRLRRGGKALVVLSSDGPERASVATLSGGDLRVEPLIRRDFGNEHLTVYLVTHPQAAAASRP